MAAVLLGRGDILGVMTGELFTAAVLFMVAPVGRKRAEKKDMVIVLYILY